MTPERRRKLIRLLVAAHVLGFVAYVAFRPMLESAPHWAQYAISMVIGGTQLGLLSIWAGLGTGRWFPRLVRAYLLACLVATAPMLGLISGNLLQTVANLVMLSQMSVLPMMTAVVVPLAILRRLGRQLVPLSPPPEGKVWQFSILYLMIITAVLAVLLTVGHYLRPFATFEEGSLLSPFDTSRLGFIAVVAVLLTPSLVMPFLAIWACLGVGKPGLRLVVAGTCCVVLGMMPVYYFEGTLFDCITWGGGNLGQLAIIAGSLLVFRACGYRFVSLQWNLIALHESLLERQKRSR